MSHKIHPALPFQTRTESKVDGCLSSSGAVTSGVPQGSVLESTLFLAYIDSVTQLPLSSDSRLILYADDLALTHSLSSNDSLMELQNDIDLVHSHIEGIKLHLNELKTQVIIFTLSGQSCDITLTLNGVKLPQVKYCRYLGVEMDSNLSFYKQCSTVALKTKKAIGALIRLNRKWASSKVMKADITSYIFANLMYTIEVWYPPLDKDKNCLKELTNLWPIC
jgi:hypothetical protein